MSLKCFCFQHSYLKCWSISLFKAGNFVLLERGGIPPFSSPCRYWYNHVEFVFLECFSRQLFLITSCGENVRFEAYRAIDSLIRYVVENLLFSQLSGGSFRIRCFLGSEKQRPVNNVVRSPPKISRQRINFNN